MAVVNFPNVPEKYLKADVLSTDSNFKLRDIVWYTGSDGVAISLSASTFGSTTTVYGVFEPRTAREEWFSFDSSTITSATSTGVTILSRGLPFGSDYTTESSTRKWTHPSGSKVLLFTDAPAFYNLIPFKANNETIAGTWTFSAVPSSTTSPSANTDVANKAYVDGVAVAGASNANETTKGIIELATNTEMGTGTSTGSTGARLVAPNDQLVKTSSGAGDANKLAVLNASGQFAAGFVDITSVAIVNPVGSVIMYGGAAAPSGWLLCDGTAVSRATYSALFTAISTAYGVGDGATTFNLPDLRVRAPFGYKSGDATYGTLGNTGGAETVTLTGTELPAHTHTVATGAAAGGGSPLRSDNSSPATTTTSSTGTGSAFSIRNKFQTFNFIVKT